jgi:phosphoribosylformimino-5-aminoimidazole carboxamide ribotide isomerase
MRVATPFDILPAIDLRGGRVVRLRQGDFARETAYFDDPVAVARRFADDGARWLHVVDLDGARAGEPIHGDVIGAIVAAVGDRVAIEVAGGLRTEAAVSAVLSAGAARAIVGTAALREPGFAARLVRAHGPDRIVVAIDVRDEQAVGDAWAVGSAGVSVGAALERLSAAGVTTFEVTAIDRDGLRDGPDLDLLARVTAAAYGSIIASGGIGTMDHLRAVEALGCTGAIVGRALYDGTLDLRDILT